MREKPKGERTFNPNVISLLIPAAIAVRVREWSPKGVVGEVLIFKVVEQFVEEKEGEQVAFGE